MVEELAHRRGLIHALSSQFKSVPDAVFELVDNAVDARMSNKPMEIWVNHNPNRDQIVVLDAGGRGMGKAGMQRLLHWGGGERHGEDDIGEYHVGGKAAIAYLGNNLRIRTKAHSEAEAHELLYKDFKTSDSWDTIPESVYTGKAPTTCPPDTGWTEITISGLSVGRYRFDGLQSRIANTYRTLLADRSDGKPPLLTIFVRGVQVKALELPLSKEPPQINLDLKLPHVGRIHGWAGRLERDRLTSEIRIGPGLRLIYNGRLIEDEKLFRWEKSRSQGRFGSLIGEVFVTKGHGTQGLQVRPDKSAFLQDNEAWDEFSEAVNEWLSPLMSSLAAMYEEKPVTKDEKRVLKDIMEELQKFLEEEQKRSSEDHRELANPEGRKPPEPRELADPVSAEPHPRKEPRPRTPPPEEPVGSLARLRKLLGKGLPTVRIESLDPTIRASGPDESADRREIIINNKFVMYPGARDQRLRFYYAETVLRQLLSTGDTSTLEVDDFILRHDDLVARFARKLLIEPEAGEVQD